MCTARGIHQSGLCISGQTIRQAANRLKRQSRMKVILNIGSVDILHGKSVNDMCNDFIELVRICEQRDIDIVITTLAPIANRLGSGDDCREKVNAFNKFLIVKFGAKYSIIDIASLMKHHRTNHVLFDCYQG